MTFEEFEEEYLRNRPPEPYCENEQPDLWAQIVAYAESNLKQAYEAGREDALKKISIEKLPDNQQLIKIINEEIKKAVCEHLSLKEHCEPYSEPYVQLYWDDTELGFF